MAETQFLFNGVSMREDDFMDAINASQEAMILEEQTIVKHYNVDHETANNIMYIRGRSRWTVAKELELVERYHAGNPVSHYEVYSGEFLLA